MTERSGGCMCGAVRFTARDVGTEYGACHCKMCQRWAGSALLAITVPDERIDWTGTENIATLQSSAWAERAWCAKCGSGLWYRITAEAAYPPGYEVPIGIFDDASGLKMTREIFVDRKPDAFAFAGVHRMLTEADVFAAYGITTDGA